MKDVMEKSFLLTALTVLERPVCETAAEHLKALCHTGIVNMALYGRVGKLCKGGATGSLPLYILVLLVQ